MDSLESSEGFWWDGQWIPTNSIKFTYSSVNTSTQFVHIRVESGGHFWFTSSWGFWNYDWGFDSHEEAYNFFMQYRLSDFFRTIAIENFTLSNMHTTKDKDAQSKIYKKNLGKIARNKSRI